MSRGPDGGRIDPTRHASTEAHLSRDGGTPSPGGIAGSTGHPSVVSFVDSKGVGWCVSEQPCRELDPPQMRCLVFMSETVIRRVLNFPPDWRSLAPDQLEALSWER
jgi:hypothetical protein